MPCTVPAILLIVALAVNGLLWWTICLYAVFVAFVAVGELIEYILDRIST